MGFVASGVWLHIMAPVQTTALIVGYWLFDARLWRLEAARLLKLAQRSHPSSPAGSLACQWAPPSSPISNQHICARASEGCLLSTARYRLAGARLQAGATRHGRRRLGGCSQRDPVRDLLVAGLYHHGMVPDDVQCAVFLARSSRRGKRRHCHRAGFARRPDS